MADSREERFRAKQQFVALFKAQLDLLRRADPHGVGRHLDAVDLTKYDHLLAGGPTAKWPTGLLPGLKQGIRDLQVMLDMTYPAAERAEVQEMLRLAGGEAAGLLEARDAQRLTSIRKRKRIRSEDEFHLVRAAIDRIEATDAPDRAALQELYGLADEASAGGAP
jgi:hypothetical protein